MYNTVGVKIEDKKIGFYLPNTTYINIINNGFDLDKFIVFRYFKKCYYFTRNFQVLYL